MPALISLLFLLLALEVSALPTPEEFALRLNKMAKNTTIRAEYIQTRHFKDLDFDMVITGSMIQQQGKRLAWMTEKPLKSICIFTENSFRLWDEETRRSSTLNASKFPWIKTIFQLQSNWMNGDMRKLMELFNVEVIDEISVSLTPKDQSVVMFFSKITILFNGDYSEVRRVVFTEKTGDTINLVFKNVTMNVPIPEETWQLP